MGWFSRRRARTSREEEFEPETAFLAYANAEPAARRSLITWQMYTESFDIWLGHYVSLRWHNGDAELSLLGQQLRFFTAHVRVHECEGDEDPYQLLDPDPPGALIEQLGPLRDRLPSTPLAEVVREICEPVLQIIEATPASAITPYQRAGLHTALADFYASAWDVGDGTANIDQAIAHLEAAWELMPEVECLLAPLYCGVAMMQSKRYHRTSSIHQLELSVNNAEAGICAALPNQLELALLHGAWAAGLRDLAQITRDDLYWDAAASAFSQAAELTRTADPQRQRFIYQAGLCVRQAKGGPMFDRLPYGMHGSPTVEMERSMLIDPDLRDRIHMVPKTDVQLSETEFPASPEQVLEAAEQRWREDKSLDAGLNLAQVLVMHGGEVSDADLARADELTAQAIDGLAGEDRVVSHLVRVNVLALMTPSPPARDQLLVSGMRLAAQYPCNAGIELARRCGDEVAARCEWATAAEAYDVAAAVHSSLVQRQLGRDYQGVAIELAPTLGAAAAIAHFHDHQLARACASLELGRAQLLSTSLRRESADMETVERLGGEEAVDQYVSALLAMSAASKADNPERALEKARASFEDVVSRIRALDGMSEFLSPLDGEGILEIASEADLTILYVAAGVDEGLVLAVGGDIQGWAVPGLTTTAAQAHVETIRKASSETDHRRRVDEACGWLGTTLASVVPFDALARRLAIVGTGSLGYLPVEGAWTADSTSGRSYLLDRFEVRHCANAQALATSFRRSSARRWATGLVVAEPTGDQHAQLPLSRFEGASVARSLSSAGVKVERAAGGEITADLVLEHLHQSDVVHLACHAVSEPDRPLASRIVLGKGTSLALADVMDSDAEASLVVISACESATAGRMRPDEVVSLPSALIEAGCGAVIGSLWNVPDRVAAVLMAALYERLDGPASAAGALRDAKLWLRGATNGDLLTLVQSSPGWESDPGLHDFVRDLSLADLEAAEHSSPSSWAAFQYVGA